MFNPSYPIEKLKGALYNPRRITPESVTQLQESLRRLGCVKPIIARGETIVAGHQRTNAMRLNGETHAPVFLLDAENTTDYDEIRFNQLHNGTDTDSGDEDCMIALPEGIAPGFTLMPASEITGNAKAKNANVRSEIMRLMTLYGPWGSCVATDAGRVIHCAQYALACMITGHPLLTCVVPEERAAEYLDFLSQPYGVFSYEHLGRKTWIQTFAQMYRLRKEDGGGAEIDNRSRTFERLVIPWLEANPGARILDFGCGQGDYVRKLRGAGHAITGLNSSAAGAPRLTLLR